MRYETEITNALFGHLEKNHSQWRWDLERSGHGIAALRALHREIHAIIDEAHKDTQDA